MHMYLAGRNMYLLCGWDLKRKTHKTSEPHKSEIAQADVLFNFGLIKQNIHKNKTRMCGQSSTPESSEADCWHVFAFLCSYVTRFNTY